MELAFLTLQCALDPPVVIDPPLVQHFPGVAVPASGRLTARLHDHGEGGGILIAAGEQTLVGETGRDAVLALVSHGLCRRDTGKS